MHRNGKVLAGMALAGMLLTACGGDDDLPDGNQRALLGQPVFATEHTIIDRRPDANSQRNAYFGDLHVHTAYSFDAYAFGTLATPYDAYRFAQGEAIRHPAGFDMQLSEPLDFYGVTDHAMFMGVAQVAADTSSDISKYPFTEVLHDLNEPDNMDRWSLPSRMRSFAAIVRGMIVGIINGDVEPEESLSITRSAWADTVKAADMYNDPGRFTTFVAYEYSTTADDAGSLHRNVVFAGSDRVPEIPFSRMHSANPEDLWDWMDTLREAGVESMAIPHNSNKSNGHMFKLVDWAGDPIDDDYAVQRIRNEPLVEITQIKGTSETHPALSTRDEWADFELVEIRGGGFTVLPSQPKGSYVREALRRGLALEAQGITNPYTFGVIGSSDTHTGATQNDESNFSSKLGILSADAQLRGSVPFGLVEGMLFNILSGQTMMEVDGETFSGAQQPKFGASGLAAVWAEENTREAIYAAFRRKETFATSGPRMRLRFFAGYGLPDDLLETADGVAQAYATGVTMGADLAPNPSESEGALQFAIWAQADANSAPLQRLQVIKGWVDSVGETHEEVIDVACAGSAAVNPNTHRCPDNGAKVNLSDCSFSANTGDAQLRTVWTDPDYDASQRAFYYARVLENPTCRWSTWDALRAGTEPRSDLAATLQERAWSSPIWINPQ